MTLKNALVEAATKAGFDLCRVTTAAEAPHAADFQKWLEEGNHGTMEWLVRGAEKRGELDLVLPGVRSIIVLATSYFHGPQEVRVRGKIARYAWGLDYHDLLAHRLKRLSDFLAEQGGLQKSYTDTGPVLERDFAARAGIGWHGKSTMILNQKLGTWFFLSVILTTLELEPDAPATPHCGSCTRCMVACPTNAIWFGDLNDGNAIVSKDHSKRRAYTVLEELNARPRAKYLAKVRNPSESATTSTPTAEPAHG